MPSTPYESAPSTGFHRRVVIAGGAGQFSDGFTIGIIGTALTLAKEPLQLNGWWLGAIGASSLLGLFIGALIAGSVADKIGRKPIFNWGMLVFTMFAALQYQSTSAPGFLIVRVLLGITLGFDYVSCKAMVTEYSQSRKRGFNLTILAVSWTSGYFCSFLAGYVVKDAGPDAWRTALLVSAVPAFLAFLIRVRMPESPLWLMQKGKVADARDVVTRYLGAEVALPLVHGASKSVENRPGGLYTGPMRRNLTVGCVFYVSQVIPFFALGTFLPIVMSKLGLGDGFASALAYNLLFLIGAYVGLVVIDRLPRRVLLVQGFLTMAALLAIMIIWHSAPAIVTVAIFSAFAFVLSVAGVLQYVYPPELFPTEVRARGIGITQACGRLGTATTTFLLPAVVDNYGVFSALGFCMVVMIIAAVVCYKWAPETLRKQLT